MSRRRMPATLRSLQAAAAAPMPSARQASRPAPSRSPARALAEPPPLAVSGPAAGPSADVPATPQTDLRPGLWLALHFPALALEAHAATVLDPEERAAPWALVDRAQGHVVCSNAAAEQQGVHPGLGRATALVLCPALRLAEDETQRTAQALQAVGQIALGLTPCVTLHDARTVLLEVHSTQRAFGGLLRLAERLDLALAPLAHRLQVAVGPTAEGSALLACWRGKATAQEACASPLAQAVLKATRLRWARSAPAWPPALLRGWWRVLDAAPLGLLPAAAPHEALLASMGLRDVGGLRRQPRAGLARRLQPGLLEALDRACGLRPDPRDWLQVPEHFAQRVELLHRADSSTHLLPAAESLLRQLVAWALARCVRVAAFTLQMHHEPRHRAESQTPAVTALTVALPRAPSSDVAHLTLLLRERLIQLELPAPTLELSLHCDAVAEGPAPQEGLFPEAARQQEALAQLIARLQARLGREGVLRPQRRWDHRPEQATRWQPADEAPLPLGPGPPAGQPPTGALARSAQPLLPAPPALPLQPSAARQSRPLFLQQPPRALSTRPAAPQQPLWQGRPLRLLEGPERIESGWWDGQPVARDYYIAEGPEGALWWLYQERLHAQAAEVGGWFWHGCFA